jgi:hypothetical protein
MQSRDLLLLIVLLALFVGGGTVVYKRTRGLRNNNPGNIRLGESWQGMRSTQTDPSFVQFISPEYGIRAMARVLRNYGAAGYDTLQEIINRWAPPGDNNDTASYIRAVSQRLNIAPNAPLDLAHSRTLGALIEAIIQHENGVQPYDISTIAKGISLAG